MERENTDYKGQYYEEFLKLKEEFETYKNFAENTIQMIKNKNMKLEKKLDSITNIVEISRYINSYLGYENLIPMINDMIIGILGVTYSSIYIKEEDDFVIKATNIQEQNCYFWDEECYRDLLNGKPFIMNSKEPLFSKKISKSGIHSLTGIPIYLREKFIGYIVVEHELNNFFTNEHIKVISTIANQIAIVLENNDLYNKIREIAIRDPLLGIYNRKYFFDTIDSELDKSLKKVLAFVMMDLDDFKRINDAYGHQFGDEVLRSTSKIIEDNVGSEDLVARYGGEEIVIFIKSLNSKEEIYKRIDKIRLKISENIVCCNNIKEKITASFGISYYSVDSNEVNELINIADSRLYIAKNAGKNKVIDQ